MIMAVAIMISTFGCNNGLILAGARALLRDGEGRTVLQVVGRAEQISRARRGDWSFRASGRRSTCCRERSKTAADGTVSYGNLYGDLLTYVISAALIFYILTIIGHFRPAVETTRCRTSV